MLRLFHEANLRRSVGRKCQATPNERDANREISIVHRKSNTIDDHYNEVTLSFRGNWALRFRVYDDGMAYRFISYRKEPAFIETEVSFRFPPISPLYPLREESQSV